MIASNLLARYLLFKGILCAALGVLFFWILEDWASALVLLTLATGYAGAAWAASLIRERRA